MMAPYLIAGVALVSALGGAYLQGRQDGRETTQARAIREQAIGAQAAQAAASAAAGAIAQIRVTHTTIQQRLETHVREIPVYADPACDIPADGVRHINDALAGTVSDGPAGAAGVPASGPADR